ncbi:hypothetical protein AMECASPLE_006676 [Ameca splendens]|uniref:Uncharacterized protein n=1 Tax=Ameca splendens TaxID=208324 RepID=A0ABV0ZLT8_9TELE
MHMEAQTVWSVQKRREKEFVCRTCCRSMHVMCFNECEMCGAAAGEEEKETGGGRRSSSSLQAVLYIINYVLLCVQRLEQEGLSSALYSDSSMFTTADEERREVKVEWRHRETIRRKPTSSKMTCGQQLPIRAKLPLTGRPSCTASMLARLCALSP